MKGQKGGRGQEGDRLEYMTRVGERDRGQGEGSDSTGVLTKTIPSS